MRVYPSCLKQAARARRRRRGERRCGSQSARGQGRCDRHRAAVFGSELPQDTLPGQFPNNDSAAGSPGCIDDTEYSWELIYYKIRIFQKGKIYSDVQT